MRRFLIKRAIQTVLVLFAISVLTFLIFQVIPGGDPAQRLAGRRATPQMIAAVNRTWGFDQSLPVQYLHTMGQIFTGQVISYSQQINVIDQIRADLPVTLAVTFGGCLIWLATGVLLGLIGAVWAGRWPDRLITVFALVGLSTPIFFVGALALYFLAYKWGIFPNGGYVGITVNPWQWFYHLILPWLSLGLLSCGVYSRVLRANVLDVMHEDFVRTARAKGVSERRVMIRHVLRNALMPITALFGMDVAATLGGGTILVETVFNLHGVGQYAEQSIANLDVPPVMVIVMFGAFAVVIMNAIVDVVFAVLDPRVRLA